MDRSADRQRTHRKFFVDPRFAIGIGLVLVSVVGVTWLVRTADQTTDVYSASSTFSSGERIMAEDLDVVQVRIGSASEHYLEPDDLPAEGVLAVRPIGEGELIPRDSIGAATSDDEAQVVVTVAGPVPSSVTEASRVTLWASAAAQTGLAFEAPVVLVPEAQVVTVLEAKGIVAAGSEVQLELRVPRDSVAAVLEATANGAKLAIVPDDQPVG
ncbi:hypothetical protein [Agreia sp. COWG]|uniref:hypothetical protein n=1 Tax=Agreia sp. COWG TaxID=2773266 RepID=UPI0019291292|nr:hypothetical protein [Agreia sp. COWG]